MIDITTLLDQLSNGIFSKELFGIFIITIVGPIAQRLRIGKRLGEGEILDGAPTAISNMVNLLLEACTPIILSISFYFDTNYILSFCSAFLATIHIIKMKSMYIRNKTKVDFYEKALFYNGTTISLSTVEDFYYENECVGIIKGKKSIRIKANDEIIRSLIVSRKLETNIQKNTKNVFEQNQWIIDRYL